MKIIHVIPLNRVKLIISTVIVILLIAGCSSSSVNSNVTTENQNNNKPLSVAAGNDQNITIFRNDEPKLGTNMSKLSDWNTAHPFLDLFKYSRIWITGCKNSQADCNSTWDTDEENQLNLDQNGWVKSLPKPEDAPQYWFVRSVWAIDKHYQGGRHIVKYQGKGTLDYRLGVKLISSDPVKGEDIIDIDPSDQILEIDLLETDPENTGDYLRNIKIIPEKYKNVDLTQHPFNPEFLKSILPFDSLRFMDWMRTNDSQQIDWNNRSKVNDYTYTTSNGVPLELQIKLANTVSASPWINIPHQANVEFIRNFSQLALERLNSGLDIYVEYSNEVWNGGFKQYQFAVQQGELLWPNDSSSSNTKAINWYGKKSAEVCDVWKSVWGNQSNRVHCIMAGQAANPWVVDQALQCPLWSNGPCYNHGIDAIAIAPYFGGYLGSPSMESQIQDFSVSQLLDEINTNALPKAETNIDDHIQLSINYNLPLLAYEAGQHLVGYGSARYNKKISTLFEDVNRSDSVKTIYKKYLDSWNLKGGKLMENFTHIGIYSDSGSWGAKEYLGQANAPKYDALMDQLNENPSSKAMVKLSGNVTSKNNLSYTFQWKQTAGPIVTLINEDTLNPEFSIPNIQDKTILTFKLSAEDSNGNKSENEVSVTLNP